MSDMHDKLSMLANNLATASNKGDLVEVDFYHTKMGRIISQMWEGNQGLMPKGFSLSLELGKLIHTIRDGEPFNPLVLTLTEDLRDELSSRGYAVGGGCLWTSDDVRPHDRSNSLTEDERMDIMEKVLTSDWIMEQINSMIQDEVRNYKEAKQQ